VRAVFLDYETVSNGDLDNSGLTGVMPGLQIYGSTSDSEVAGRIADAEIVLLNTFVMTRALVHGAKHLKLIALAATGTDNVDLAASMGLLLEMMGNDVRVTHDGSAAVNVETEFRPDVVFLDIGMTKMNGFDACTRIRGKPWGKEPVIVALTGWGQPEDKRRSREAGFDHHLVKPIEPAALERFLMDIES